MEVYGVKDDCVYVIVNWKEVVVHSYAVNSCF